MERNSESAGFILPNSLSTEASIKQGCLYFYLLWLSVPGTEDCDQDSIIQAYNYVVAGILIMSLKQEEAQFCFAESFSKGKSG